MAFANVELETKLQSIDALMAERSFSEVVSNCSKKIEFSKMSVETRNESFFKASYKKCNAEKVVMDVRRSSGTFGVKKAEYTYTAETFKKFKGNSLRELLFEMTNTTNWGETLSLDMISFYEIKEITTSLRTKNGYEDFNAIQVWINIENPNGETEQLHVTIGNDSRLPFGALLLEVFYNTTPLLVVTAVL